MTQELLKFRGQYEGQMHALVAVSAKNIIQMHRSQCHKYNRNTPAFNDKNIVIQIHQLAMPQVRERRNVKLCLQVSPYPSLEVTF